MKNLMNLEILIKEGIKFGPFQTKFNQKINDSNFRALKLAPEDKFLLEIMREDRDQDACLRAAIEIDPKYTEGINCLIKRCK